MASVITTVKDKVVQIVKNKIIHSGKNLAMSEIQNKSPMNFNEEDVDDGDYVLISVQPPHEIPENQEIIKEDHKSHTFKEKNMFENNNAASSTSNTTSATSSPNPHDLRFGSSETLEKITTSKSKMEDVFLENSKDFLVDKHSSADFTDKDENNNIITDNSDNSQEKELLYFTGTNATTSVYVKSDENSGNLTTNANNSNKNFENLNLSGLIKMHISQNSEQQK